ncbi:hypothetical protein MNBD_GAMMA11-721 [hydrothermal vent metagenome]|uniref:Co-chaperone DjlA N-terminal domain-containing protein n=1 Tax=hydrothermal vent metagenome TaxID=652676 RepID=A0A3B0X3T3_9ZZZZ
MSKENRDYLDLTFRTIECFKHDGTLQVNELEELVQLALKDGVLDDNEKRILKNIFSRLTPEELSKEMLEEIEKIRSQHNF